MSSLRECSSILTRGLNASVRGSVAHRSVIHSAGGTRSAAIAGMRLRGLLNEAKAFYTAACEQPTDIRIIYRCEARSVGWQQHVEAG